MHRGCLYCGCYLQLRAGDECLAIQLEIALSYDDRARIHEGGNRRSRGGVPVFEFVYSVVVKVVREILARNSS